MTSLGRVGRILAGTVDVSNSTVEKDNCSTNASSVDISAANITNSTAATIDFTTDRKAKSSVGSSANDSSSNDNTSNSTMMLQGRIGMTFCF